MSVDAGRLGATHRISISPVGNWGRHPARRRHGSLATESSQTLRWRDVDSNFLFRALNERRTAPISRGAGRPNALPSRRLPIDKITSLDARFRYLRAVSMRGVMQRGLRCYRHYTD
jgi:hypothetical protein